MKASDTVIKCREVLKWTYAYGYFAEAQMEEIEYILFQQWQTDLE